MAHPPSPSPLLLLLLAGCPAPKGDDTGDATFLPTLQLSYEAIPGNGFDVGGDVYDTSGASYETKASFTAEILDAIVPGVLDAVGADPASLEMQLTPGGFMLATSPSLQIRGSQDPDDATALAAALGWTCYQWSVLVTNFDEPEGDTGFGTVSFAAGALTPTLAQAFFEHAASVDPGLAGGYTAFGDDLIFLNLRDSEGSPYSGVEDDTFIADLESAAQSFADAAVSLSASGEVEAALVENDWTGGAPTGEDYAAALSEAERSALDPLRADYLSALQATGAAEGWIVAR